MQILSFPEAATPHELRRQVLDLQQEAWPDIDITRPADDTLSHDPALRPLSMLIVDGETVLAALDILHKEITHAGERYRAGGLSTVVTRAASQGQGHGRRLVTAARDAMATDLDLGIFTCDRPLRPFYESAGWELLPGTALVGGTPDAPLASDQPGFDKVTMAAFFSGLGRRNRASFEHTRIELYPGSIDKLW